MLTGRPPRELHGRATTVEVTDLPDGLDLSGCASPSAGCSYFPTVQAAMKCLLVTRSLDPKGTTGRTQWALRWKPALNIFAITFADRVPAEDNWFVNRHLHRKSDLAVSVLVSVVSVCWHP